MNQDKMVPLCEYPRMQMVRNSYLCLNGEWDYIISNSDDIPHTFFGKIVVPYSPEAPLSNVNRVVTPNEFIIYRRSFRLAENFNQGRVFLHFQAVDQIARVY